MRAAKWGDVPEWAYLLCEKFSWNKDGLALIVSNSMAHVVTIVLAVANNYLLYFCFINYSWLALNLSFFKLKASIMHIVPVYQSEFFNTRQYIMRRTNPFTTLFERRFLWSFCLAVFVYAPNPYIQEPLGYNQKNTQITTCVKINTNRFLVNSLSVTAHTSRPCLLLTWRDD